MRRGISSNHIKFFLHNSSKVILANSDAKNLKVIKVNNK